MNCRGRTFDFSSIQEKKKQAYHIKNEYEGDTILESFLVSLQDIGQDERQTEREQRKADHDEEKQQEADNQKA